MAFRIEITDLALRDAEDYVEFLREVRRAPEAAARWFRGLVRAIYSLEESPERCPLIPESDEFSFEIRHLIFHSHRIVYRVFPEPQVVVIYRVYHGSRQALEVTKLTN